MKYDFETVIDRSVRDALAVDEFIRARVRNEHIRLNLALPLERVRETFTRMDKYIFNI